jgi:glycerate-2-kinase
VRPGPLVRAAVSALPDRDRPLVLIAAGKAAWPMALAFSDTGVRADTGLIAGPRATDDPIPAGLAWIDGAHPVPNAASIEAGARALALVSRGDTRLVLLLSGGASSMLALPAPGVSLADKVATSDALMRAGADIAQLNTVRKHLSAIKGGRLGAAARASITLAISDVHGPVEDDPSVIGSGPTVADPTAYADAHAIVARRFPGARVPKAVIEHLEAGVRGALEETPKPGRPRLARSEYHVLANRHSAMRGAAEAARACGLRVHLIAEATSGEARVAGRQFAERALAVGSGARSVIASGETTVRVAGRGRGGRNQEFALGAAEVLRDSPGVVLASAGTDGIDGPTDAAGAIVDSTTIDRARAAGLSIAETLAANDTYPFFATLGDLIRWGPTGTNVGDLHVLISRS